MTLVTDASAAVESVLGSARGRQVDQVLRDHDGDLHAPELYVAESLIVLRRLERLGELPPRAEDAAQDLLDLPIRLYSSTTLAIRVWNQRGRFRVHHAHYIALAEACRQRW